MSAKISLLKLVLGAICLTMLALTIATSVKQNLMDVLPRMVHDPWTVATFVDFYFNITIISLWMAYKENHAGRVLIWFVSFVLLGSIATSFYALLQVWKLKPGDSVEKIFVR